MWARLLKTFLAKMTGLPTSALLISLIVLGAQSVPQKRIINGSSAGDISYLVKITSSRASGSLVGTGNIITKNHVLTSASQIVGYNLFRMELKNVILNVQVGTPHPEFDPETLANDVGIIRSTNMDLCGCHKLFWRKINNLTNYILDVDSIIPLPDANADPPLDGQIGFVRGYGAISTEPFEFPTRDNAQEAAQQVLNTDSCKLLLGDRADLVTESHFCIQGYNETSMCFGDQGAGFVSNYNGEETLTGLVSIITNMCHSSSPDIVTNVALFVDWIEGVIATNPPMP